MKKRTFNNLTTKGQFNQAVNYLKESKNYIYTILSIFFISMFLGYIFAPNLGFLDSILSELIDRAYDLPVYELFFFILQNNLLSSFLGFILGFFLGIFPLLSCFFNGVVLGYVMNKAVDAAGIGVVWRLFPHGIFELPAVFISLALGLKFGMSIFSAGRKNELKRRFFESLNVFLMIVIPLLILAAFIEAILVILVR